MVNLKYDQMQSRYGRYLNIDALRFKVWTYHQFHSNIIHLVNLSRALF